MKTINYLWIVALLGINTAVYAASSEDRSTPLDDNPSCMDRNGPPCVVKDNNTSTRRAFPGQPTQPYRILPNASASSTPTSGSYTAPNAPPADQTGDFSRLKNANGQSADGSNVSRRANSGQGKMRSGAAAGSGSSAR